VTAVADPLGGSWYVEKLTRELEEHAWELIQEVEAHGGMTKAVAEGLPKHRIEEAAAARAAKVDTGETVIVGVNKYRPESEPEHDILEVDNARVRAGQIARIEKVRASRDDEKARAALDALEAGARSDGNLLALSVEAARVRCTLGEISECAGAGVWALRHRARAGARDLRQGPPRRPMEVGGGGHTLGDRPLGAKPRIMVRENGPGRARPRRQPRLFGLHRSGLRSGPRPLVPDPARDRANGGRA
jgi:methylmalonyl-CoA mutase